MPALDSVDYGSSPWLKVKESAASSAGDTADSSLIPGWGRSPGGGNGNPVFLPEKSLGQRSLVGYSPWGHKESDTTEHAHTDESVA